VSVGGSRGKRSKKTREQKAYSKRKIVYRWDIVVIKNVSRYLAGLFFNKFVQNKSLTKLKFMA